VAALRQGHLFLRKAFNAIAHNVNPWFDTRLARVFLGGDIFLHETVNSEAILEHSPRSSLAFNSNTASLYASPSICRARHKIDVVLPMPGMPEMMTWGMLPSLAMILRRSMVSVLPTTSSR
jgi:hypothetical protein